MKHKLINLLLLQIGLMPLAANARECNIPSGKLATATPNNLLVDTTLEEITMIRSFAQQQGGTLHLFTHGRPGELLWEGKWIGKEAIANLLTEKMKASSEPVGRINIYGCEFGKGELGKEAVAYLQQTLRLAIAASDDITGKDGDWILEAGIPFSVVGMETYTYNLQCPAGTDTDGDGVPDMVDMDDDNDGISDINEGICNGITTFVINAAALGIGTDITRTQFPQSFTNVNGIQGLNLTISSSALGSFSGTAPSMNQNGTFLNDAREAAPTNNTAYVNSITFTFNGSVIPVAAQLSSTNTLQSAQTGGGTRNTESFAAIYTVHGTLSSELLLGYDNTCGASVYKRPIGTSSSTAGTPKHNFTRENANANSESFQNCGFESNLTMNNGGGISKIVGEYTDTKFNGNDGTPRQPFQVTISVCTPIDTDGDGIPDYKDLDSDNDGIPDAREACGNTSFSTTSACRVAYDATADTDNNGDGCKDGLPVTTCPTPIDTDHDGTPDYRDLDSDGDGCPDATEARVTNANVNTTSFGAPKATTDGLTNAGCFTPVNNSLLKIAIDTACKPIGAVDDHYNTTPGIAVTLFPLTGDSDPGGETLLVGSINGITLTPGTAQTITVPNGVVTVSTNGTIRFTPATGFTGTTSFPYQARNMNGEFANAREIISIATPLPVILLSFTATAGKSNVALDWTTVNESNNKGFAIERSNDGQNWTLIDFVNSRAGSSDSGGVSFDYHFIDVAPFKGKNYYRLVITGHDLQTATSAIQTAYINTMNDIKISPNPARKHVLIAGLAGDEAISIYDATGKKIFHTRNQQSALQINTSGWNNGFYLIYITDAGGNLSVYKILKTE